MSNEQKITNNIKVPNKNKELLKKHFSHCFEKNGYFDIEKFKQELSENEIDFYKESYGLDWLGKSYARILASDEAKTLLKEDNAFNQKEENKNSQNLLIKGDNLEVLKHLSNAYYEKIKMIYIDPPYNTGGDGFVYQDDRKFTVSELRHLSGIDEEKAKRILDFTQSKSNSHSAWLTFIYPRLYLAKQLLKEDGMIFVSIDDNEVTQLRLLMDDIFGEDNFIGCIIWKNVTDNNPTNIAIEHEYIVCYSKNKINLVPFWKSKLSDIKDLIIKVEKDLTDRFKEQGELQSEYSQWFRENKNQLWPLDRYKCIDKEGVYTGSQSVHNPGKEGYRYDIPHPKTNKPCKQPLMGYRFPYDTMKKMIDEGRIIFGNDEDKLVEIKVYAKDYLQKLSSVLQLDGRTGANELRELFPSVKKIFTNPKTVKLLQELISFACNDDDIIVDFFAGSGTTGDSIMRLNADDGGNRKYILVQLPEKINQKKEKAIFDFVKNELRVDEPTIFEITKERLIRASKKIKEETFANQIAEKENEIKELNGELDLSNKEKKIKQLETEIATLKNQDLGFRIFETMPIWEDYGFEADELDPQLQLFDETKLTEEDIRVLLVTWKTYDGTQLNKDLHETDLGGYTGYFANEKLYLMHKGFTTNNLKTLLEKIDSDKKFNPTSVIAFGYHFESKNLREIAENIKSYTNKKNIDIDFITRY
ncbi:site-specific DNA-methyltransferase [Desulfobacula sp.]|uniref:site-specific DNA-methyltransferase n=1 Tax=Desulfobacula sp. TaxID=2593537 RepID=UPI0026337CEB|nr:site-specific DNA-methyltransferase [Desulfobacula sp.]